MKGKEEKTFGEAGKKQISLHFFHLTHPHPLALHQGE